MSLVDLLGYGELDLVAELISHRREITRSLRVGAIADEPVNRLQTKEERERSLRRQDWEHKHAALGPATRREAIIYPHVYKTHEAGNILSTHGHKYALPKNSERREHEVHDSFHGVHRVTYLL